MRKKAGSRGRWSKIHSLSRHQLNAGVGVRGFVHFNREVTK